MSAFRITLHLVCLAAVLALVQAASAVQTKTVDKRTKTDADGNKYFLVFVARSGGVGHAYSVWGVEDSRRRQSVASGFGFYPNSTFSAVFFGFVPGSLRNEALNPKSNLITHRLIVLVNKQEYLDSQKAQKTWATSDYNKFEQNCIDFTRDVAKRINLKVPAKARGDLPSEYLVKLFKAN
jgi:hypothetical protein